MIDDVDGGRRRDRRALQPVPLGDARLGADDAVRRSTPVASATDTPDELSSDETTGSSSRARLDVPPAAPSRPRRGRRRARGGRRGRTRCGRLSREPRDRAARRTPFRPARDRRRDHRRRDRRARGARPVSPWRSSTPATSAAATSSASSKLIHGGLRYLRLGDVRLVREAHHERRVLTNVVAPHLVHRLPFLLPLYEGGPFRPGVRPERDRALLDARALAAQLARRSLIAQAGSSCRRCGSTAFARARSTPTRWTNDARLCLENVRAAAEARGDGPQRRRGRRRSARRADGSCGAEVGVDGEHDRGTTRGSVVNAAGPWVDHVRRLEDPRRGTSVRLSKGVHVLVPRRARTGRQR